MPEETDISLWMANAMPLLLLKKVISLDPERENVHYQMGYIHYQKNDLDQALQELQLALHHLESAECYYNLSLVYLRRKI